MAPLKPKDDSRSMKSSTKLTTSSLVKKTSDSFNKLKHKATKLLGLKKKKTSTPLTAPSGAQGASLRNQIQNMFSLSPTWHDKKWPGTACAHLACGLLPLAQSLFVMLSTTLHTASALKPKKQSQKATVVDITGTSEESNEDDAQAPEEAAEDSDAELGQ